MARATRKNILCPGAPKALFLKSTTNSYVNELEISSLKNRVQTSNLKKYAYKPGSSYELATYVRKKEERAQEGGVPPLPRRAKRKTKIGGFHE